MISDKCFTKEWQAGKRQEMGGCDPLLLEKTIYAFALLDALSGRGLDFVFKGGTSLLLRLPRIRRLSIDADILCSEPATKLDPLLAEISISRPFIRMTEDERGKDRLPARRHFKFFYNSLDSRNPAAFVLLDVVHARNVYPQVDRVPVRTTFVESDGELLVPTVEGLLGDKLTAFGPNTTGVPLNSRTTMQVMKQVFDIGELFDSACDISAVSIAYRQVFSVENEYRGGEFTFLQALEDSFETAYLIAQVGLSGAPDDDRCGLFDAGRKQLASHLVGAKFRREEMKIAAAKAALLSSVLRTQMPLDFASLRYDATKLAALSNVFFKTPYAAICRLKAIPEAMWLWAEAFRLKGPGSDSHR